MIDLTGSDSDDEAPAPSPQRAPKRTVDQVDLTADDDEDDAPRKMARTAVDVDSDAALAAAPAHPPCITEFTEAQLKEPLKLPNGQPNPAHPCIIWRKSLPKKRPFTVKLIIDDAAAHPAGWAKSHRGPRAGIGNDGETLCFTSIVVQAAKPKNPIPKIMAWLKKNKMSIRTYTLEAHRKRCRNGGRAARVLRARRAAPRDRDPRRARRLRTAGKHRADKRLDRRRLDRRHFACRRRKLHRRPRQPGNAQQICNALKLKSTSRAFPHPYSAVSFA